MPSLSIKDRLFYGWVVVAAFIVIGIILYGTRFSFGVFFKSIESEFSLTRAATSGFFSAYMIFGCAVAILGGWALDKYGPRIVTLSMGVFTGLSLLLTSQINAPWQLFITYSLILSLGTGTVYIVVMATISRWFDKKRGLALGIGGSGTALGTVIMAPFATYLISTFDWRMAYAIIGLIACIVVIPLSRVLKKDPYEIGALPDGVKSGSFKTGEEPEKEGSSQPVGSSLLQAFRTRIFWFFVSIWLLYSFCYFLILTHIVPHATDMGISATEAAAILSLIGGSNLAGRLLMGRLSDNIGGKTTSVACALLAAGAMVWLIWSKELWMLYLFGIACGFSLGGLSPTMTSMIGHIFGMRSIGMILGALEIGWAIGGAIGPLTGGYIFDVSNSYFMAFLIGALAMLAAALLIALTKQETSKNV